MSGDLPQGACDSHCHVFGPAAEFPFDAGRTYTPADAPKSALFALHRKLGLDRAVIVHPGAHGFDNSVTLDAIAASGGSYRGVALVPETVTTEEIAALDAGGMRGVRFNFVAHLAPPPPMKGFRAIVERVAPFGWHVVMHLMANDVAAITPYIEDLSVPFVIDHMARIPAVMGVGSPPFQELLRLMKRPNAWVKISAADRISEGAPYTDAIPFARALVEAAPDRVLWGTDWPHPNIKGPVPDETELLALLRKIAPEPDLLRRILVDNPARLYRF